LIPTIFLPETYGPVLLQRRARRLRRADPSLRAVAPHELEARSLAEIVTIVLARPLRMLASELIVASVCAYLSLIYAVFYMTFQTFPLIFQGIYGLSPGECGLVFLSIGVGSLACLPLFWWYDGFLARAQARGDAWTRKEEYRRVPLACLAGPILAISLFWLGWSAREGVIWVVPMLAGVPFGMGFMCRPSQSFSLLVLECGQLIVRSVIFMALLNYVTGDSTLNRLRLIKGANTFRRLRDLCRLSQRCRFLLPLATRDRPSTCLGPHVSASGNWRRL
jgi:hypothetical protein